MLVFVRDKIVYIVFYLFLFFVLKEGVFTSRCLREFWRNVVPPNFCPHPEQSCIESLYDESQVVKELIQPLELFICGSPSVCPEKVMENLSKNDNPPALCGRVFRMGEPTYRYLHFINNSWSLLFYRCVLLPLKLPRLWRRSNLRPVR